MFVEVSISIGVHIPEVNWTADRVTNIAERIVFAANGNVVELD